VRHYVLWENVGVQSIRVQPNKSNTIVWLNKAWTSKGELDPGSEWPPMREVIRKALPHAASWIRVLELAREDTGIDIKDDCRLEDCSARCHQDGNNCVAKGKEPLVRLALNVSNPSSGRTLDYLDMKSDKRIVDGEERESMLLHSVSQHLMWHGAAQTVFAYIEGIAQVCHGSSAGTGPCLKRIITVFALQAHHPLARLTPVQRLLRIGIEVHAIDEIHQLHAGNGYTG